MIIPDVAIGQWVRYNDEEGHDTDALVRNIVGLGILDLVIIKNSKPFDLKSVPHYNKLLETKEETREIKKSQSNKISITENVTRRKAGHYWRD